MPENFVQPSPDSPRELAVWRRFSNHNWCQRFFPINLWPRRMAIAMLAVKKSSTDRLNLFMFLVHNGLDPNLVQRVLVGSNPNMSVESVRHIGYLAQHYQRYDYNYFDMTSNSYHRPIRDRVPVAVIDQPVVEQMDEDRERGLDIDRYYRERRENRVPALRPPVVREDDAEFQRLDALEKAAYVRDAASKRAREVYLYELELDALRAALYESMEAEIYDGTLLPRMAELQKKVATFLLSKKLPVDVAAHIADYLDPASF